MNNVEETLRQQVAAWETLGHPALMERFVLRNGRAFMPARRVGRRGRLKQCYANATSRVLRHGGEYVEGYTLTCGLPISHAWVTLDGVGAMDPTLPADEHEYFGVVLPTRILTRELGLLGHYGILDTRHGLNHRLMFELDPELESIVSAVMKRKSA